jgi:GntR family transcriptional regulator
LEGMSCEDRKEPLYFQVKRDLMRRVQIGEYRVGDTLPSEEVLAREYGVSRITVKRAVLDLVSEGVLYRRQGKGTFVAAPKIEEDLSLAVAVVQPILMHSDKASHKLISAEVVLPDPEIARHLDIDVSSPVIQVRRTKLTADEPIQLEHSYIPESLCPGLNTKMNSRSSALMYEILEHEYGFALMRAKLFIEPTVLDSQAAKLLKVRQGMPAMLWTRITYTTGDRPIEFYKSVVRGDRFKYYIEFPSNTNKG